MSRKYFYNRKNTSVSLFVFSMIVVLLSLSACDLLFFDLASRNRSGLGDFYTVTFNTGGGSERQGPGTMQVFPPAVSLDRWPDEPVLEPHLFAGWYINLEEGRRFSRRTVVSSSMTVYARWQMITPDSVKIIFDKNNTDPGGINPDPKILAVDVAGAYLRELPLEPTRPGWFFAGWNTNSDGSGEKFSLQTPVTPAIETVYAQWERLTSNDCIVTFDSNGGATDANPYEMLVTKETYIYIDDFPIPPRRERHKFIGWNTRSGGNGETFDDTFLVKDNITVYAQWEERSFTISFDTQGGTGGPVPITVNYPTEKLNVWPREPSRSGYIFTGWFMAAGNSTERFTRDTIIDRNVIVFARWVSVPGNACLITFDNNGGDTRADPNQLVVNEAGRTLVDLPNPPTRNGFRFTGWRSSDGRVFDRTTPIPSNMTVYAQWEKIHTVTFDSNRGLPQDPVVLPVNPSGFIPTLPNQPTYEWHTFVNWNTKDDGSGTTFTTTTKVENDITVYAQWNEIPHVVFDFNYESTPPPAPARRELNSQGRVDGFPANPARTGFRIIQWNTNANGTGTTFTSNTVVTSTITVYAIWIEEYTVTFYVNKNPMAAAIKHTDCQTNDEFKINPLPAPPEPDLNKKFDHWNTSDSGAGTVFTASTVLSEDLLVYAMWADETGDGTENNPFRIRNETDLRRVGTGNAHPNGGPVWSLSAYYRQIASFTMSTGVNFTPIGTGASSNAFTGSYDGGGHTISNLTITRTADYTGLFGYIAIGGKVYDLGLLNVNIKGGNDTGSLVGRNGSSGGVERCYVIGGTVAGADYTGGLFGFSFSVSQTFAILTSVTGADYTGGLAGNLGSGSSRNNYAAVNLVSGAGNVGGLAGRLTGGIYTSYATGKVVGTGSNIGGLTGIVTRNSNPSLRNSVALNPSVEGLQDVSRIYGLLDDGSTTQINNNYGRALMSVKNNLASSNVNHNRVNGVSINAADHWEKDAWWQGGPEPHGTNGPGFDPDIWNFHGAEKLPTLKNIKGSVVQNPQILPAPQISSYTVRFHRNHSLTDNTFREQNIPLNTSTPLSAWDAGGWTVPNPINTSLGTNTQFRFAGWSLSRDGHIGRYNNVQSVSNLAALDETINLYAQWDIVDNNNKTGAAGSVIYVYDEASLRRVGRAQTYTDYTYTGVWTNWRLDNNRHYEQIANITLTSAWWGIGTRFDNATNTPHSNNVNTINSTNIYFWGVYDGRNHTVSNITINAPDNWREIGFFRRVGGAVLANTAAVKNLHLVNVNITSSRDDSATSQSDNTIIGGLAGSVRMTNTVIENCSVTGGSITAINAYQVGGLAGYISASDQPTIKGCSASITVIGNNYVGGLTGYFSYGEILNCYATGNVTGTRHTGGLSGWVGTTNSTVLVNNSYATGNATGTTEVGGLIGTAHHSNINNCFATGNATSTGSQAGGLIGNLSVNARTSKITNSFAAGNVVGNNWIGGISGSGQSSPGTTTMEGNIALSMEIRIIGLSIPSGTNPVIYRVSTNGVYNNNRVYSAMNVYYGSTGTAAVPGIDIVNSLTGRHGLAVSASDLKTRSTWEIGAGFKFGNNNENPWVWETAYMPRLYWMNTNQRIAWKF